ncbi:sugar ABC transporter permease [Streptomyces angustmyceticus]|uniref:sugar ABC transporter permease n=1 Tax=Streptomyces angustmyceticus TaxID=285578 RepID=UPI003D92C064
MTEEATGQRAMPREPASGEPDGPQWAEDALAAVWRRTRETEAQVGARFPLYADPGTGVWRSTSKGSWTGGFWAGLLWLRALDSGAARERQAAVACTGRLAHWVGQDTATRGLIFWYGTALAAGPGEDGAAARLGDRAARACLAAYDAERGLVPWGDAFGGPRLVARADAVPGLVPLLAGRGPDGADAAWAQLTRQLTLSLAEHPPRPAWRAAPDGTWTACSEPAPGWSRTVPWLLLAVVDGLHFLGQQRQQRRQGLWEAAEGLVGPRLGAGVPLVPRAYDGRPDGPVDTSAAAIEAVALLKLAALLRAVGRAEEAWPPGRRARRILHRLSTAHLSADGGLTEGCYDADRGLAPCHELIWGDFFLAAGLAMLTGRTDPFAT